MPLVIAIALAANGVIHDNNELIFPESYIQAMGVVVVCGLYFVGHTFHLLSRHVGDRSKTKDFTLFSDTNYQCKNASATEATDFKFGHTAEDSLAMEILVHFR